MFDETEGGSVLWERQRCAQGHSYSNTAHDLTVMFASFCTSYRTDVKQMSGLYGAIVCNNAALLWMVLRT